MPASHIRREYGLGALERDDLLEDALQQFRRWFEQAVDALGENSIEPNSMTLATADADGRPDARVVLLKDIDDRGISFYTNYNSPKGRQLEANPRGCCVLYWPALERQVRLSGPVERVSRETSESYFSSRPRESRIGAWASPQSEPIDSRNDLEQAVSEHDAAYPGENVPLPPFWGGYRLLVEEAEFWQGRESRLHDRFRYSRQADGSWRIERLAP